MISIDRFEGDFAVCINEKGEPININISEIPKQAKEGTILTKKENLYIIHEKITSEKREKIKKLQDSLWE